MTQKQDLSKIKTSVLLDMAHKEEDDEKRDILLQELDERYPMAWLFDEIQGNKETIEELQKQIKKLKNHIHVQNEMYFKD